MEKNRYIKIQVYFATHENEYISSHTLADISNVSVKTIKKDMPSIDQAFQLHGAKILSKHGRGYMLAADDIEQFAQYKSQLELIDYYRMSISEYDEIINMAEMIRMLLRTYENKEYLRISSISDDLYLSQQNFNRVFKKCTRYLSSYNIKIKSVPNKGSYITGDEFHIRLAILSLEGTPTNQAQMKHNITVEDVLENSASFRPVRKIVLNTLRGEHFSVREEIPNGLTKYIFVSDQRNQAGCEVVITERTKALLKESQEYALAHQMADNLAAYFTLPENEIYGMAAYIMCNHDYSKDEIMTRNVMHLAKEICCLYDGFTKYMKKCFGMQPGSEADGDYLFSVLAKMVVCDRFYAGANASILGSYHDAVMQHHTIELQMSQIMASWIETNTKCRFNMSFFTSLSYYFIKSFEHMDLYTKKMKLVTVSPLGVNYARILAEEINSRYADKIASNHAMELYEIRPLLDSEVDLVVLDHYLLTYYKYKIPTFILNGRNLDDLDKHLVDYEKIDQSVEMISRAVSVCDDSALTSLDTVAADMQSPIFQASLNLADNKTVNIGADNSNICRAYGKNIYLPFLPIKGRSGKILIYQLHKKKFLKETKGDYLIAYTLAADPQFNWCLSLLFARFNSDEKLLDKFFHEDPESRRSEIRHIIMNR